jgi:hypothetical protein
MLQILQINGDTLGHCLQHNISCHRDLHMCFVLKGTGFQYRREREHQLNVRLQNPVPRNTDILMEHAARLK